jgi:phospholipid/cholesterol/gamma-HCH transport system permease protein
MTGWIHGLGGFLGRSAETTGYGLVLLARTISHLPHLMTRRRMRDSLDLCYIYCTGSFTVTAVVALFTGMILALNGGLSLQELGQESLIGRIVAVSLIREMGPFMTALILTASIGSGIAAELGTMKISEEIDALRIMSISPVRFLILPRLVALTLVTPVLTIFAGLIGILGGIFVAHFQLGVGWMAFRNDALEALTLEDIQTGLFKSVVFGVTIATVGCTQGLLTRGGATGVGQAARRAVVVSFLLIIIMGYYISWSFLT